MDKYVSLRHKIAHRYNQELKNLPILTPYQHNDGYSAFHLYVIRIKDTSRHKEIFKSMRMNGIGVNLHYIPVYRHPYFNMKIRLSGADQYYKSAISLPIFPAIGEKKLSKIVREIENICK